MKKSGDFLKVGKGDKAYKPAPATGVSNERKADLKGTGVMAGSGSLAGAMGELHSQHPEKYCDMGPHHGGSSHVRHMPLHGMKSKG